MVRIDSERPFSLGAMHVPNRVTGRKYPFLAPVLRLALRWRGGPALLAGDTNSGRIGLDEEVPVFGEREDSWMTALENAGWSDAFRHAHGEERAYTWYSPTAATASASTRRSSIVICCRVWWTHVTNGRCRPAAARGGMPSVITQR